MKVSHYIKRVKESDEFKKFKKEDPKAYLCSLFFIRDFTEKKNETQVDFYSTKKKCIVSFKVDGKVERTINKKAETMTHKKFIPKQLNEKIKLDIDEMKDTLTDEMHNREMTYEIEKVLSFLNMVEGKPVWNCTGFLKGLGILQAHVDDETNSILFMEKKSFFDLIKFTGKPGAPEGQQSNLNPDLNVKKSPKITIINEDALRKKLEKKK
ncbi:MAG: hypothetical protein NTW17_02660 [Candidatus Pacearchaeota archaeon]|nr:hypothetical protein [Candidatus Pacearchaeota archaeon]